MLLWGLCRPPLIKLSRNFPINGHIYMYLLYISISFLSFCLHVYTYIYIYKGMFISVCSYIEWQFMYMWSLTFQIQKNVLVARWHHFRALKVNKNRTKQLVGYEMNLFLTYLHHILHARSCNHFLWFPHTPNPPRPLKRPKNFNLLFTSFQLLLFVGLLFRAHLDNVYTSRAGAIT